MISIFRYTHTRDACTSAMGILTSCIAVLYFKFIFPSSSLAFQQLLQQLAHRVVKFLHAAHKSHLSIQLNSHMNWLFFWQISNAGRWHKLNSGAATYREKCLCNFAVQTMSGACWIEMQYCCWLLGSTHISFNFDFIIRLNFFRQWFECFFFLACIKHCWHSHKIMAAKKLEAVCMWPLN